MLDRIMYNPNLLAAVQGAFVWQEHTEKIITAALLSMVPTFEGRYAVTVALGMGMPPVFSYLLALITSSIPIPIILLLLRPVLDWFYTLPIRPVRKFAAWLERHAAKKRASMNEKNRKGIRGRPSSASPGVLPRAWPASRDFAADEASAPGGERRFFLPRESRCFAILFCGGNRIGKTIPRKTTAMRDDLLWGSCYFVFIS